MYAIVEIAGKQFKVSEKDRIKVPKLEGKVGSLKEFDRVLLVSGEEGVKIGKPTVPGVRVEATILAHGKDKKIIVFKKKPKKDYKVKKGHRQGFSQIQIARIKLGGEDGS